MSKKHSLVRRTFLFLFFFLGTQYLLRKLSSWGNTVAKDLPMNPLPSNPLPPPPVLPPPSNPIPTQTSKPIEFIQKTVNGVLLYQTIINLRDPHQLITIGLANQAPQANSNKASYGDEDFTQMVKRHRGAVTVNGTFFSKDEEKRVLGNMVAGGEFLKYSRWENYGTTLGIKQGNQLEMITARVEGQPNWQEHWFSLTCGPRLLKQGQIWLDPTAEGFKDPHIFDAGWRGAIGYPAGGEYLYLVTFEAILTLEQEAELMKAIGCVEAMNLDGGASRALAHRDQIIVPAGRNLTNIIVVYDTLNPPPETLIASWRRFQEGHRAQIPA